MYKIAAIGDKESIYGFAPVGIEIFPVYTADEGRQTLMNLAKLNYGVIFVTEALAEISEDIIEKYSKSTTPAIILIPGVTGNTGKGMSSVMKSIERAVGSQIDQ